MALREKMSFVIIIGILLQIQAFGAEWPQWRGPGRDGVWREDGIVQSFEGLKLPVLWRAKIANGYSGPTVANGRVYITDRLTSPAQIERVHCFDATTGEAIWSYDYPCKYERVEHGDGPRASVSIDAKRAYSLGTMGHFFCFDAANGDVIWSKNLLTEYKIKMPPWGLSASPLVDGNLVIVQIGGRDGACLAAFDKVTGQEKWRALDDPTSYSAPIIIEQAGKRVLVCWTAERLVGLDPLSGKLYWEQPYLPGRIGQNIATPVCQNGYLFVSSFFDGSLLVKLGPGKLAVKEVWRRKGPSERSTDSLHCCISTPILEGNYIYGVDSYGELRCLDLKTGDRIWENRTAVPTARWSNIHMVRHDGEVWMFNERGELVISRLSPEGFHEISRTGIIEPTEGQLRQRGGVCWAHPAFAYKNIYVRNDRELLCIGLAAKK
jgi:outer membrane protein assembly factor BamB